jgi:hypothetical protein
MTDPNQRAIGVELNGQVWNGTAWVPKPPQVAQATAPGRPASGGWLPGSNQGFTGGYFPAQQVSLGGFANPIYAYGLTKRAADDISFIARFTVIMIWIWIIGLILSIVGFAVMALAGASLFSRLGR